MSGTFVTRGSGRMLVLAVGARSSWGQLLALLVEVDESTPLQTKLLIVVHLSLLSTPS